MFGGKFRKFSILLGLNLNTKMLNILTKGALEVKKEKKDVQEWCQLSFSVSASNNNNG